MSHGYGPSEGGLIIIAGTLIGTGIGFGYGYSQFLNGRHLFNLVTGLYK